MNGIEIARREAEARTPIHKVAITDAMRESVRKGQATFSMRPMSEEDAAKAKPAEDFTKEELAYKQAQRAARTQGNLKDPKVKAKLTELRLKALNARKLKRFREAAARRLNKTVAKRTAAIRERYESQRATLEESMKSLETLVQALPVGIRGKFKGFGKLSGIKTKKAQDKFLRQSERRVQSIFDEYLVRENRKKLEKLLKLSRRHRPAVK